MNKDQEFDAIVIGSGMGSLTAATLLAKCRNFRVLVLEQHYKIGGQTHAFFRNGKAEFDVGLHYIGVMDRGEAKKVFDFITNCQIEWQKMPDEFEKFSYPEIDFSVPSNKNLYKERLILKFPDEKMAIERYFKDIKTCGKWYGAALASDALPPLIRLGFRVFFHLKAKLANMKTEEYLNRNFKSPVLKALLTSQWGDYGVPPQESAFGMHALLVAHYLRGAWYPVGGAKMIAQAMIPIIEQYGGKVLKRKKVSEILIKNKKAYGVRVDPLIQNEESLEYFAPIIISGTGAINTYLSLVPGTIPIPFRNKLKVQKGFSALCLYLVLKDSPETLGIKGENYWVFDSIDYKHLEDENGVLKGFYLSFPSLKNKLAKLHTADVITFVSYDHFEQWKSGKWKNRGDEYETYKKDLAQKLLEKVNKKIPGLIDLVEFMDISTPLTMEHFLNRDKGMFYGVPMTTDRLFKPWTHAKTPIQNLFLTGSDVMAPGIVGAMMGGVKTAGVLFGSFGFLNLMKQIRNS